MTKALPLAVSSVGKVEVIMRTRLKVGLLAAFIACGAFVAAKAQDEKSYLPPGWFQGQSETKVNKTRAPRTVHARPVRHASVHVKKWRAAAVHRYHRRIRVAHHWGYHRPHYAYYRPHYVHYPRYAFYRAPGFLYGLFGW